MTENITLDLIGRTKELFEEDISKHENLLNDEVSSSSFLVIGGAGSIGQAVTKKFLNAILKNFM